MNIAFIGAGKVGFSLGKYLSLNQHFLSGFYSKSLNSSMKAAEFTGSKSFTTIKELIKESDIIFITVPDGEISSVAEEIVKIGHEDVNNNLLEGKFIGHCSGACNHTILSELESFKAHTFSLHPFLAISDKYNSYQDLSNAFFTIEGDLKSCEVIKDLIESCHNKIQVIKAKNKVKYHAAAVFASNLMIGLVDIASEILMDCGINEADARFALKSLTTKNLTSLLEKGAEAALTGPIERNDLTTISSHLTCLSNNPNYKAVYKDLSMHLLKIAANKHPDRDYAKLANILESEV